MSSLLRTLLFVVFPAFLLGQPTITTASPLPSGTVGSPYSTTLTGSGGSGAYLWSVGAGALPAVLTLDQNTGVISGTPNTAGTFNFIVLLQDRQTQQSTNKAFSLTVIAPLTITTASPLPYGTAG